MLLLLASTFLYIRTRNNKSSTANDMLNIAPASQNNNTYATTYTASTSSDNSKPNTENKNITVLNSDTTESNPKPKINSINKTSYKYGDTVEVRGENFYALENDKIVIIENEKGEKIYLDTIWNQWHSYISFVLPSEVCSVLEGESGIADCKDRNGKIIKIEKGAYKLYYPDFGTGELSNSVNFSIE